MLDMSVSGAVGVALMDSLMKKGLRLAAGTHRAGTESLDGFPDEEGIKTPQLGGTCESAAP